MTVQQASQTQATNLQMLEVPIAGMDCAECARTVDRAIARVPGVQDVSVLLAAEKAVVRLDSGGNADAAQADAIRQSIRQAIRQAVADAGYAVVERGGDQEATAHASSVNADDSTADSFAMGSFTRRIMGLLTLVFGGVLFIVVVGEWMGLFAQLTARVPFWAGLIVVLVTAWPVLRNVLLAARRGQVTAHTLMTVGMLAALIIGEWATAAVVVFLMRMGDYAERFTMESSRRAVKDLMAIAPQTARVERVGAAGEVSSVELPIEQVGPGDTVVVRPGEKIPVDGEVIEGQATVDQATITGESMPVEVEAGATVFAATWAQLGSLRIRTTRVGADTTFGRVVRMVEEAEAHRSDAQRLADKVSGYYLPVVVGIATLTFLIGRDPLATAAVLLVACSCAFALATPVALLASIGAGAKQGLLIKGGKYLETLARADVLLIDKTGTLTLGTPIITDVIPLNGLEPNALLALAASAERDSEHPLAAAVRNAAQAEHLALLPARRFSALPGLGVSAQVDGTSIAVGNARLIPQAADLPLAQTLRQAGKTLLFVARDDELVGILAATDTLRAEVPAAIEQVRKLGVAHVELLTGDNEQAAAALAHKLGVQYRAELLPEDKIDVVKRYQAAGRTVVMVGDGVNDAPALAQADIGIAMGAAGTDIAMEAAHIALMREDWALVPKVFAIARRTMGVVRLNLGFTIVYNLVGLTLAAFGFLPPIVAAAAQSVPDLGIMANSARLLRSK